MALFLRALLASVALLNLVPSAWAQEPPKPGKQHDHLKRLVGSEAPAYEAYAVRFATAPGCPLANLVQGADPKRTIDLAMTFWVLKGPGGRTVLVDAGFYRQEVLKVFGVADFTRPDKALERLGIKPDEVTDVILTHMHSDHVDGADLFPKAQIWIQKEEYAHYAEKTGRPGGGRPGSEPEYIRALVRLNTLGRVHLVDGDAREIIPGVTVYTGGKHTFASQYVGVNTKAGTVVIASDNVYTYENLEKHVPIAATLDAKSNLAAQDRMKKIASNPRLIIPGHDPAVFVRFPKPGNGVARLE
jgi:glyoxylase-like metal-dependent hydrolase (beta-lactamase superfamily II)